MRAACELFATEHVESVAICLINSFVNPEHERRARDIIARELPELSISISSEVSPQMREFERFNTVCANAFVKPLMASYLGRLVEYGPTNEIFLQPHLKETEDYVTGRFG